MRRKLFMALALVATMAFGCIVFESASYAQNSNSSTTNDTSMSGTKKNMRRSRRHRKTRRHRRTIRRSSTNKNANQ